MRDDSNPVARLSWLDMAPAHFDTDAPDVQGALFAAPDPLGTPDMFGDQA